MRAPGRWWAGASHQMLEVVHSSLEAVETIGLPILIGLGIACAQITLLFRGEHVGGGIAATLVWMAGAVLLSDVQAQTAKKVGTVSTRWSQWFAVMALGWCLLVLTFSTRLYDPLLFLLPLVCFVGIAVLEGTEWRSRTMRDLILIGGLLLFQHALASSVPTGLIVTVTAKLSCIGLWGLGKECYAETNMMYLPMKTIAVDPPCAGVETLCLSLTSALMFMVLFPIRRRWHTIVGLITGSLLIAFLLNAFRVLVLSLSSKACDKHWWSQWCGFDFWHLGAGSHLFALAALSGVCWLWWWDIDRRDGPFSPNPEADPRP